MTPKPILITVYFEYIEEKRILTVNKLDTIWNKAVIKTP